MGLEDGKKTRLYSVFLRAPPQGLLTMATPTPTPTKGVRALGLNLGIKPSKRGRWKVWVFQNPPMKPSNEDDVDGRFDFTFPIEVQIPFPQSIFLLSIPLTHPVCDIE